MVAQRADEVVRHIRALVHIAADGAHKADALFCGLGLVLDEVGRRVLAQRADEIGRERLALVHIAAHRADQVAFSAGASFGGAGLMWLR